MRKSPPAGRREIDNGELSPVQLVVITKLLSGEKQGDIAAALELSPGTVSRWLNHHATFTAEYNRQRLAQYQDAITRLDSLAATAFNSLGELMQDPDPGIRLKAVQCFLSYRGPLSPPEGETDPARLVREWHIQDDQTAAKLLRAEVFASIV